MDKSIMKKLNEMEKRAQDAYNCISESQGHDYCCKEGLGKVLDDIKELKAELKQGEEQKRIAIKTDIGTISAAYDKENSGIVVYIGDKQVAVAEYRKEIGEAKVHVWNEYEDPVATVTLRGADIDELGYEELKETGCIEDYTDINMDHVITDVVSCVDGLKMKILIGAHEIAEVEYCEKDRALKAKVWQGANQAPMTHSISKCYDDDFETIVCWDEKGNPLVALVSLDGRVSAAQIDEDMELVTKINEVLDNEEIIVDNSSEEVISNIDWIL